MIMSITSRRNEKIIELVRLRDDPKERLARGLFLAEGFHLFRAAFAAGALVEVYLLSPLDDLPAEIPQYVITEEVLAKIALTKNPEGIVALCRARAPLPVEGDRVLYLDDIGDPGNLGTILRSALAFGYLDVIMSRGSCAHDNPKVVQASQGAIFSLNIKRGDVSDLRDLRKKGYKVIATAVNAVRNIANCKAPRKHVLVLGNESRGVSLDAMKKSDVKVKIKIKGIDSLNVGVAAGVAMYELTRPKA